MKNKEGTGKRSFTKGGGPKHLLIKRIPNLL